VGGARGAEGHDEGDGRPQIVDRANLRVLAEGLQESWPLALHGAEFRLASDLLIELLRARRGGASGASEPECAPALEEVEVLVLRDGEERLVGSLTAEGELAGRSVRRSGPWLSFELGVGTERR
jgi:hypothetical protein